MSATDKSTGGATPRPWYTADGTTIEALGPRGAYHVGRMEREGDALLVVVAVNRSDAVDALVEAARLVLMDPWEAPTFLNLVALRAALAAYDKEPDA